MARALHLAERGLYTTAENPRVGCVLVKDDAIIAEGWHQVAGGPHAEVDALHKAGAKAKGASAFITLEPCCFRGKTGACTDALVAAGIKRVVAAMQDPNPQVAGRGGRILAEKGIEYSCGLMQESAQQLNPGFISRMTRGLPWVRLKMAASLDGRTALASGESQWITGQSARDDVHHWRARSDAIITGIGTISRDNPQLNARLKIKLRQPLRVVLDSNLAINPLAHVLQPHDQALIICREKANSAKLQGLQNAGLKVESIPDHAGRIDLLRVLRRLADLQMNEVWIESGSTLAGSFLQGGLVNELVVYLAPKILGDSAMPLLKMPALENLQSGPKLEITDVRQIDADIRIIAACLPE